MNLRQSALASFALSLALGSVLANASQAQQQQTAPPTQQTNRGSITGLVRDAESGQPLGQVTVSIVDASLGANTTDQGRYTIANVPQGIYSVRAQRVGHSPDVKANVRVTAGQATTLDFTLSSQALILNTVVATGLVDPATGVKAPFSVATVRAEQLEVASMNSPLEALAGKVAGLQVRGGNLPGSDVVIQIRNPLTANGYTQPLIIVDGVIQMQDDPSIGAQQITGNPLDLNGDNIESIEIVRGAAAAALYGERAANGVINITTKRGQDLALGTSRFQISNEAGFSRISKQLPYVRHHRWLVDETNWPIDRAGRRIETWENAENTFLVDPNLFVDNVWGMPIYDNVAALFKTGVSIRNNAQMSQNTLSTNFGISGSALHESGIMREGGGTSRQNLGINVDYRAGTKLSAGIGMSYAKVYLANLAINAEGTGGNANAFLNAQAICVCVDIKRIDPATGTYVPHPDGVNANKVNPLYFESHRDEWDRRIGAQASASVNFRPTSVFSIRADGGYQRSDREEQIKWIPVGTLYDTGNIAAGEYDVGQAMDESYNVNLRLGILTGIGGWTVRAGGSTDGRMQKNNYVQVRGDTLTTNQRDLDFVRRVFVDQNVRDTRNLSYSANVAFDYNQKYILDLVYRTNASSLLPRDSRWNSNGRASAAWSMSDEPWWPLADFTLFKPRYSIGTAGSNPRFADRFELFNQVTGTGVVRINKTNLGNEFIKPEEVTEQEFGLDIAYRSRHSLQLNYVRNKVENAIRADTILAYTGFDTQRTNLGDFRGDSYEATFESQWIQKRNLRWSSTLVLDRGRQKITRYPRQCPEAGNSDANSYTLERFCEGYVWGQMYGRYHITQKKELSPRHWASGTVHTHFGWNDEGLLVALGPNSQFTDMRWGQGVSIDGLNYSWGLPLTAGVYNLNGSYDGAATKVIGQGLPDVAFGIGNQLTVGRMSLTVQTVGQLGGVIQNQAKMRAMNREQHAELDQSGKPDYLKKPISYYINTLNSSTLYGGVTGGRVLAYPRFLESGTFLKINELRLAYRLDQGIPLLRQLGMSSGSIALITRDVLTFSSYSGYDPQVAGQTSITTARVDRATAPNYKNITAQIRLVF